MTLILMSLAWAHQPGLSYVRVERDTLSLTYSRTELGTRLPVLDLDAGRVLITEATLGKTALKAGDTPCSFGDATVQAAEGDAVEVRAPYDCPTAGKWTLNADWLPEMSSGHRAYVEVLGQPLAVLDASSPSISFDGAPHPWDVAKGFVLEGVHHIWLGYDHLAFLFGLLLAAGRLRDMFFVVTGFTVAHSITLSLAATGVFTLSPAIVEPLIAASILFVGVENLFSPPARRRVFLTFFLGLIHGFGFAGALAELGLPRDMLGVALLCFNVGVELGQAAIVLAAMPLLLWLHRLEAWRKRGVPALSVAVALAGLGWLVERLAG